VELGIPGRHNILNALAATALALEVGVDFTAIARGLASFAGAKRRFETKYLSSSYRIVDDYGHHPTEIAATLQTARSLNPKRLVVLFQPHRYTRTQLLCEDFGKVLQVADQVFVADVYPASEQPIPGISGQTIVDSIHRHGPTPAVYLPNLSVAHHAVGNFIRPGDLLLTLGAGNVHECGKLIANDLGLLEEMLRDAGPQVSGRLYEPMRKHTTMAVGGCAQFWLEPQTVDATSIVVNFCRDRSIPVRMIGRGSNVIVREGGIRGAVVHPDGGEFDELTVADDGTIEAGAGVRLKKIAGAAAQAALPGFEWMDGIPGNVGGSLRMNAGSMGQCMKALLVSVTSLEEDGSIRTRSGDELSAVYRSIPELVNNFALKATFKSPVVEEGEEPVTKESITEKIEASRKWRRAMQPIGNSAGCIFKNPESIPAGKLIDELGLKGTSIGDAYISDVHANFIINRGNARATDVTELIDLVRKKALEERGIELKSEAQVIGDREPQF
jgi:UDP-N-acetylenolpyruvoylglucosamine reductase